MPKIWMLQKSSFGLGNFIMATPAIRLLSEKQGRRVKVFFETASIGLLYKECPFIKVLLKKPNKRPFYTIGGIKRKSAENDIQASCRILKVGGKNIPHTYVDPVETSVFSRTEEDKCVAVFHGCLGKCFRGRKDVGAKTRQYIIDRLGEEGFKIILLGTSSDYKHYWSQNNLKNVENFLGKYSLNDSVGILRKCDSFISNDTGLYHVASALKIKGLVLWKKTRFGKNKSPFEGIEHCVSKEGDFDIYKKSIDLQIGRILS